MFDVSEANGGEPFDTLSDALNYADTVLLPEQKKGGMTIKYIQSYDNKYVIYSLTNKTWSINVSDWKNLDNEITQLEQTVFKEITISPTLTYGYIDSLGTVIDSSYAEHTDFLDLEGITKFRINSSCSSNWYLAYYSEANESSFISSQRYPISYSDRVDIETFPPKGAKYARLTVTAGFNTIYATKLIDNISGKLKEIEEKVYSESLKYEGIEKIGFLNAPNLFDADILYMPMYGQSYTEANDGNYKITESFDSNVFMHGLTSPIGVGSNTLRPLSTPNNSEYEIADIGNVFSQLIKKYIHKTQDILVGSYGQGSRSIQELSPNNGYGPDYHAYEDRFVPGVENTKAACDNANKTIKCPFILFLQGESDTVQKRTTAATADSWCKGDKILYKTHLVALKNSMQATIKEKLGQSESPLFVVYTCGNTNFNSIECGIQQAVLECCEENDDMFTVGSYYYMTSMGAHLSPDGRRWNAELFAKQLFELFQNGEETTMKVISHELINNTIVLHIKVPQSPMCVDTWTYPRRANFGFNVYSVNNNAKTKISLSSILINENNILLNCAEDLSQIHKILVTYGNNDAHGGGNIRDSGKWRSFNKYKTNDNGTGNIIYIPKDEDDNPIIGKNYPMQSWLQQFGIYVKDE